MKFARIFCATALVVIGSIVLVNAGHYGQNQGALTHYGGGQCHGNGCYNRNQAQSAHGAYGPYHSYAVRPAVYGGHGLYTYKGYARHHPAPAAHYRHARSYNAGPARQYRGGSRYHNAAAAYDNHHLAGYALRPVKALALVHSAPAYDHQPYHHHGGHYRAARSAYGYGNGNGHYQTQQSYGHGHGLANGASRYGGNYNHATRHSYGNHGGNGGY